GDRCPAIAPVHADLETVKCARVERGRRSGVDRQPADGRYRLLSPGCATVNALEELRQRDGIKNVRRHRIDNYLTDIPDELRSAEKVPGKASVDTLENATVGSGENRR